MNCHRSKPRLAPASIQSVGYLALFFAIAASLRAAEPGIKPPDRAAIEQVLSGQRTTARASWWGFNPQDSTTALQSAIHSGASRLIVENMGAPWVVNPIQLAGHQEIVFEKGVVVLAKRNAFHGRGDALFTAALQTNVTLTGPGATLRMWKQDYAGPGYTKAEWRHTLSLLSCAHVRVTGLTLADSGGDGIYLGVAKKGVPNQDVQIKDVRCVNNYRQGISVISAEDLLIEDCVLKDTGGTAPQAGIDFEPNYPNEKLVRCIMRNCVSENNQGDGFEFYLKTLSSTSAPVSIRLENCRSVGCRRSLSLGTGNAPQRPAVNGAIEFVNCQFERSRDSAITIHEKPASGCAVRFINCVISNPGPQEVEQSPIVLGSAADDTEKIGGIEFADCLLRDPLERCPIAYHDGAGLKLKSVTGTLTVERNGQRTRFTLNQELIDTWLPHQAFKEVQPFQTAGVRYEPVILNAVPGSENGCNVRQRGTAEYLFWAKAGQNVTFTVTIQPVGRTTPSPAPLRIVTPSGRERPLEDAPGGKTRTYSFSATESGAHRLNCKAGNATVQVASANVPICACAAGRAFHFLGTTGEVFFWVPANTREFGLRMIGGGGTERVRAALFDSNGKQIEEKDNIDLAHQFYVARTNVLRGETWSLRLDRPSRGVLEDYFIQMQGLPPLLACSKASLFRPTRIPKQ